MARCNLPTLMTLADEVREEREAKTWTTTHELLAGIVDMLAVMRVEHLAGVGVKPWKLPEVRRVPRPGEQAETVPTFTPRQFALMTTGAI